MTLPHITMHHSSEDMRVTADSSSITLTMMEAFKFEASLFLLCMLA